MGDKAVMHDHEGRKRDRIGLESFVRAVLDKALEHDPETTCIPPELGADRIHPLAVRFVSALGADGYEMNSTTAWKQTYGSRKRMELEDLIVMVLVTLPASVVVNAAVNDRARATVVRALCDTFRSKKVVLVRRRRS